MAHIWKAEAVMKFSQYWSVQHLQDTTFHKNYSRNMHNTYGFPPGCPKSPRETQILRTSIQGQKRILDSHWGMFDFWDSLPHEPVLYDL